MPSYLTVTEPDAEMVRVATELVQLTWLESCLLFNDDRAVLKMTLESAAGWDGAPSGAREWFDALRTKS